MAGKISFLFARGISFSVEGEMFTIRGRGIVFAITQRPIPEEFLALKIGDAVTLHGDETAYEIGGIEMQGAGKNGHRAFVLRPDPTGERPIAKAEQARQQAFEELVNALIEKRVAPLEKRIQALEAQRENDRELKAGDDW